MWTLAFTPDSKLLVLGGVHSREGQPDKAEIRFWDFAKGKVVRTLDWPGGLVYDLAFSPDGKRMASGDGDGAVRVWDLATGRKVREYRGLARKVITVGFNPAGDCFGIDWGEEEYAFLDLDRGKRVFTFSPRRFIVESTLSPDGKRLATAHNEDGKARLWDTATGESLAVWSPEEKSGERAQQVLFVPGSSRLLVCGWQEIRAWEPRGGRSVPLLEKKDFPNRGRNLQIGPVRLSPDGKWLAVMSCHGWGNLVDLWELPGPNRGR
jgi:WD40 repeat protein